MADVTEGLHHCHAAFPLGKGWLMSELSRNASRRPGV